MEALNAQAVPAGIFHFPHEEGKPPLKPQGNPPVFPPFNNRY
jgi:hypothetical protein